MAQTTLYELNLDFAKEMNYSKAVLARQGDKGITITVNGYLHGLPMIADENGFFTLKATTPTGLYVDAPTVSVTGNSMVFQLDERFLVESGYYQRCYVEYRTPDSVYTTQDIILYATKISDPSAGEAKAYISQLEKLIELYNQTFDDFMKEIQGDVDILNGTINEIDTQAKAMKTQLDDLKKQIENLGKLSVRYSNSVDFGDYDYSGNPNLFLNPTFSDLSSDVKINTPVQSFVTDNGESFTVDLTAVTGDRLFYINNLPTLLKSTSYTYSIEAKADIDLPNGIRVRPVYIDENSKTQYVFPTIIPNMTTSYKRYSYTYTNLPLGYLNSNFHSLQFYFPADVPRTKITIKYNIKTEKGTEVTPYQPNLLDEPYYLSKVPLGENIANKDVQFPIKSSAYTLYQADMEEEFIVGQTYTLTMKATKPSTQRFIAYMNTGTIKAGDFIPVEGLPNVWQTEFTVTQAAIDSGVLRTLAIYQFPSETKGACQIDWLKIEKGDTRTPNIEQYKYRGIGMRDSNNPKDYVWNLAPKYVEDNLITDTKISEIVSQANKYTDGKASEINSQLTVAISAVEEKVNNNKVLIQKNKDRIIGGYRVNDLMQKTHYSAHRGNNADFPENSSMAMKKVIRHKFSEFDVQTTSDGKWVVMHDATVDRMTNGTGRVDSFTYEELRKLRIDTGNNLATLPDWEKVIPNLDEALKYNRMAGTIPMIEIKVDEGTTYTDEELADFVNQLKLNNLDKGGCIVISFSADVLRKLRSLSETLEIMWVTYDMSDTTLNTCKELRMHVDPQYSHETVTRSQVQKFHEQGLLVAVWTCPDEKFGAMEEAGVDIITTNSRSGDLRWSQLTLKNGYTGVTWAGYLPPCVEEINKGLLRLSCTVTGGSNTQNTVIAEIPEWAQPYLNSSGLGMVRTGTNVNPCSVDVIGKIAGTPSLVVGLGWENRTAWAMINIDYKIL